MTAVSLRRPPSGVHADPLAGRFLGAYLVSLLLHGLLLFGLAGGWLRSAPREDKPPVYYVDLIHKPVLNPQAGRPEPRVAAPVSTPVAPVARVEPKTVLPSKSLPTERKSAKVAAGHVSNALQKLRDEQALQQKFAALRQAQAVPIETPVGLPDARGNEAGVTSLVYVQAFIQQNWALSPYLLADPAKMARTEAWVRITYGKGGRLESFRFEKESRDPQFDESIKRALAKSKQLPSELPVRLEDILVVFNLKALAELRR
ncbi:MAG: TonB C-terminal domain-containing protein [Desulfuromonadales bacterium]|nr:TonB C-terminal domain-containing protein [Desulfuromonadales bacterium]